MHYKLGLDIYHVNVRQISGGDRPFTFIFNPANSSFSSTPVQNLPFNSVFKNCHPNQKAGRFYHVKGVVGLSMDHESQPGCALGDIEGFKDPILQFRIPRSMFGHFKHIAAGQPPPHAPRALMDAKPDPPVENCSHWVDDVLRGAKDMMLPMSLG